MLEPEAVQAALQRAAGLSLHPVPAADSYRSHGWWCDVAAAGCARPEEGAHEPAPHWRDESFFVCQACWPRVKAKVLQGATRGFDLHALDEALVQARKGGVEQGLIQAGERRLQELNKVVQKSGYAPFCVNARAEMKNWWEVGLA